MTQRTTKTITVSLPPKMVDELDRVRRNEHRTRSELLREALRSYMASAGTSRSVPVEDAQQGEIAAMRMAREEYARGETVSLEDLQNELGLPTR
jgi:metal-responsive CopG/Arc/MetJ family transcriptional regulator